MVWIKFSKAHMAAYVSTSLNMILQELTSVCGLQEQLTCSHSSTGLPLPLPLPLMWQPETGSKGKSTELTFSSIPAPLCLTRTMLQELEKGMQEMMASYSVEEEAAEAALPEPAKQASKKAAGGSKRARTQPKGEL